MQDYQTVPAQLFDLPKQATGTIPITLIKKWAESERSEKAHEKLLQPYKKTGVIVTSDSAGLSKISQSKSLIEVMRLVNEPKEIIYQYGTAVGGKAINVWAADNTQMFYEAGDAKKILHAMMQAQSEIQQKEVQVGIGIKKGEVYLIEDVLYGKDADEIEEFTEEKSNGGEIVLAEELEEMIKDIPYTKRERMCVITSMNGFEKITCTNNPYYPAPFSKEFHDAIRSEAFDAAQLEKIFVQTKTVVLVRVFNKTSSLLLEKLTNQLIVSQLFHATAEMHQVETVKSDGNLGIFVCETDSSAKTFAEDLGRKLNDAEITANIGIASGEVLLFALETGGKDIAGNPINIASKFAEDTEERNTIFIHDSVIVNNPAYASFTKSISGIDIAAWKKTL